MTSRLSVPARDWRRCVAPFRRARDTRLPGPDVRARSAAQPWPSVLLQRGAGCTARRQDGTEERAQHGTASSAALSPRVRHSRGPVRVWRPSTGRPSHGENSAVTTGRHRTDTSQWTYRSRHDEPVDLPQQTTEQNLPQHGTRTGPRTGTYRSRTEIEARTYRSRTQAETLPRDQPRDLYYRKKEESLAGRKMNKSASRNVDEKENAGNFYLNKIRASRYRKRSY